MMVPGLVSLNNLQSQTPLLLPGPEFPSIEDVGKSVINTTHNDNIVNINQMQKITGLNNSSNNKLCTNLNDNDTQKINESGS